MVSTISRQDDKKMTGLKYFSILGKIRTVGDRLF